MGLITALGQSNRTVEPCSIRGVCLSFLLAILLLPHPPRCRFAQSRGNKGKSQRMLLPLVPSFGSARLQELSLGISAHFAATSFLSTLGPLCPAGKGDRAALIESGGSEASFFPVKPCGFISTSEKEVKQSL